VASASSTAPALAHGVAPLRAGQGYSFLLRRLHSLSGIVPVGAFLFEHILISNSTAITGPDAYARQVTFWRICRWYFFWSCSGSGCRLRYHALYGFYIWYRGDGNAIEYPWSGNWMYTAQRWTGGIAFVYIVWHTYTMRFTGVDLHAVPAARSARCRLR
jgi:succinate dehydrogenase / fumarate reductase, cytochrome b subunit